MLLQTLTLQVLAGMPVDLFPLMTFVTVIGVFSMACQHPGCYRQPTFALSWENR
jgi:hypothetical protein